MLNQVQKIWYTVPEIVAMGIPRWEINSDCRAEGKEEFLTRSPGGEKRGGTRRINYEKYMKWRRKQGR